MIAPASAAAAVALRGNGAAAARPDAGRVAVGAIGTQVTRCGVCAAGGTWLGKGPKLLFRKVVDDDAKSKGLVFS